MWIGGLRVVNPGDATHGGYRTDPLVHAKVGKSGTHTLGGHACRTR